MEEPIITFGTDSLIIEMFPEPNPAEKEEEFPEPILEPELETIYEEPEPKPKSWCILS